MDPKLGGYPTPIDVGYPFEYGAPKPYLALTLS